MDNKIIHINPTQKIADIEFLPILRGEAPYYGNLNRPAQSAYNLANTISQLQSWGGNISILQPDNQSNVYTLYEIVKISDTELVTKATTGINDRYGIVVAEAEFDSISGVYANIVVCTFCPNFVYPNGSSSMPSGSLGASLYINITNPNTPKLSTTVTTRILGKKTGLNSIFFSGTATLW